MLASSVLLAPHFAAWELGADNPAIDPVSQANLYQVAAWLEHARDVLGVPLVVDSGFRTPERNAAVGGSATSDHLDGLAADFTAQGLTPFQVYQRLRFAIDAGELPPFDQLIFYVVDDHVHIGLGPQLRGSVELAIVEGGAQRYLALTSDLARQLRGAL